MKLPWYINTSRPYEKDGDLKVDLKINRLWVYFMAIKLILFEYVEKVRK